MADDIDFQIQREELRRQWAAMTAAQRSVAWERFTQEIDEGSAGWNRYRPILWTVYELGMDILQEAPS